MESTADRMAAVGLKSDARAVEQGIAASRCWVVNGQRDITRDMIAAEVERRGLQESSRRATLLVQAIDHASWAEDATVCLDWVNLFAGNEARERRQLRDPTQWNERLWPELEAAQRRIRGLGFNRVLVRAHMRLPAYFATGAAFCDTRGLRIECMQREALWDSKVVPADFPLAVSPPVEVGAGLELAVGLSVTNDLSLDVLAHVRAASLPVQRFVHISVAPQPSKTAIPDAERAMGWALRVRDVVRAQVRETGARKVHLFMSGPAGGALFLGHVWNRVPTTQVYEDLNPGYAPAFLIPG